MTSEWPTVRLSDILELQRRWLTPDPDQEYAEIGVRCFGKGIFHKTPVSGLSLGNKRVLRIEPGDLVFNNVFAWEGAVAVASESEAGRIGSHRFITLTPREGRADVCFLQLFFRTKPGLDITGRASPGSAGRNRTLGINRFLAQSIPLPPLPEQRRIVAKIDQLAQRIDEAKRLRDGSACLVSAVLPSKLNQVSESLVIDGRLSDVLVEKPRNGWSARRDNASDGIPILTLSAVTGFEYDSTAIKRTSEATQPDAHYWLRKGDLLVTHSNAPDLVGHAAIYDGCPAPCIFPDLIMRVAVDESVATKRFVWYWMRSPVVRTYIQEKAKGTSPTMKKIAGPGFSPVLEAGGRLFHSRMAADLNYTTADVDYMDRRIRVSSDVSRHCSRSPQETVSCPAQSVTQVSLNRRRGYRHFAHGKDGMIPINYLDHSRCPCSVPRAMSAAVKTPTDTGLIEVRPQHNCDLARGLGRAPLPAALARKYPNADPKCSWQWVFPAATHSVDRHSCMRCQFYLHETVVQKAVRETARRADIRKHATRFSAQLRDSSILQYNYDIRTVQELLGNKDVSTTADLHSRAEL